MDKLAERSARKINNVSVAFKRSLYHEINKSNRLIAIKGARGIGKTTLLLQLAKEYNSDEVLYVALDDLFFSENTLYSLAEKFAKIGGKIILIDEVHKYPNWSRELNKTINGIEVKIDFDKTSQTWTYSEYMMTSSVYTISFHDKNGLSGISQSYNGACESNQTELTKR